MSNNPCHCCKQYKHCNQNKYKGGFAVRLHEEFETVETLWNDPAYWVTASGKPVNQSNTVATYKEKFQQLVDIHIKNMKARDAKAHGRWLPTHDFTINALDETPDIAFLTYSEKFHQGTNPQVRTRKIDASYNKHNKKYKVRTFLDGKLVSTETGDEFNNLMDYLCWRFLGPKLGTAEYDSLIEWVDKNGNKIATSSNATTVTPTKQHPLNWPYSNRFAKIIDYHMRHTPGTRTLKKDIMKYVFQYEEQKTNGLILDIVAGIDDKEDYHIKVFHDRMTVVDTFMGNGYDKFLDALAKYMTLPNKQDQDYKNLLVESVLTEFVDKNGQSISLNSNSITSTTPSQKTSPATQPSSGGNVYAWSVYIKGSSSFPKNGWLSAEYFNGHLEGAVFSTPELAEGYAWDHLNELEDEGELFDEDEEVELTADDFTIETVTYPKSDMNNNVDLIEFVDRGGQKVTLNSNSAAPKAPTQKTSTTSNSTTNPVNSTPASQPPVKVTKPFKRKMIKNKLGLMIYNWQPEFIKLGIEIWNTTKKPTDEKDSGAGPSILRIYFEMPNGEEWRLEVTNTKYSLAKGISVQEDWDYVISTDRNGSEVIIKRGKTKDYNEFLDILLGLGIISDKRMCI